MAFSNQPSLSRHTHRQRRQSTNNPYRSSQTPKALNSLPGPWITAHRPAPVDAYNAGFAASQSKRSHFLVSAIGISVFILGQLQDKATMSHDHYVQTVPRHDLAFSLFKATQSRCDKRWLYAQPSHGTPEPRSRVIGHWHEETDSCNQDSRASSSSVTKKCLFCSWQIRLCRTSLCES
jgi:hypothetical protein